MPHTSRSRADGGRRRFKRELGSEVNVIQERVSYKSDQVNLEFMFNKIEINSTPVLHGVR